MSYVKTFFCFSFFIGSLAAQAFASPACVLYLKDGADGSHEISRHILHRVFDLAAGGRDNWFDKLTYGRNQYLKSGWILSRDTALDETKATLELDRSDTELDGENTDIFGRITASVYLAGRLSHTGQERGRTQLWQSTGRFTMHPRHSGGCGNDWTDPASMRAARKFVKQLNRLLPDCELKEKKCS